MTQNPGPPESGRGSGLRTPYLHNPVPDAHTHPANARHPTHLPRPKEPDGKTSAAQPEHPPSHAPPPLNNRTQHAP
ncbi:hypothetical protein GCM10010207_69410 [Streptomyces atratus]|nr:hypothetical protein GCM10010207_69410 [Streptomyces atratus]